MVLKKTIASLPTALYADGGCAGKNPSGVGGTWAFVWVGSRGEELHRDSGVILPGKDVPEGAVTNNVSELWAALKALESVPRDWPGILYTDSRVTLLRLTTSHKFAGVPQDMRLRCLELRRVRKYMVTLVAGHPTRKELAAGVRERNGLPTSRWNVLCDSLCQEEARLLLEGKPCV